MLHFEQRKEKNSTPSRDVAGSLKAGNKIEHNWSPEKKSDTLKC